MKKAISLLLVVSLIVTLCSTMAVAHTAYSFSDAVAYKQSGEVWCSYMYGGRSIADDALLILQHVVGKTPLFPIEINE